ncbi:aminoglycoside phosphotransferase family protein [Roseovarius sp. 2305UL8-3]|uniref:aminoglycoside phosphotransferase family protein n=1 Tax=Roseovarius conchicola TaxID=3121636 RepID=UPI00352810B4
MSKVDVTAGPKWNLADTAFVNVSYEDPTTALPTKLFVKIRQEPDPLSAICPGEQKFYETAQDKDLPIAPCLASLSDKDSRASCIILQDLSRTHEASPWPLPPPVARCVLAVRSLAKVHAHWAQAADDELYQRETQLDAFVAEMLPGFLTEMGDRLSGDRAALLARVCKRIPELKATRYESPRPVTRIHGDAHFWNVLYPKDETKDVARLIDWEDWRIDFVGLDLALMIAMHWYPQRRDLHEVSLLKEYLRAYNECDVAEISWEDFWHDYRLGHICNAPIPVFQHSAGKDHASWWSHLERWFLAFEDLNCSELL